MPGVPTVTFQPKSLMAPLLVLLKQLPSQYLSPQPYLMPHHWFSHWSHLTGAQFNISLPNLGWPLHGMSIPGRHELQSMAPCSPQLQPFPILVLCTHCMPLILPCLQFPLHRIPPMSPSRWSLPTVLKRAMDLQPTVAPSASVTDFNAFHCFYVRTLYHATANQ